MSKLDAGGTCDRSVIRVHAAVRVRVVALRRRWTQASNGELVQATPNCSPCSGCRAGRLSCSRANPFLAERCAICFSRSFLSDSTEAIRWMMPRKGRPDASACEMPTGTRHGNRRQKRWSQSLAGEGTRCNPSKCALYRLCESTKSRSVDAMFLGTKTPAAFALYTCGRSEQAAHANAL